VADTFGSNPHQHEHVSVWSFGCLAGDGGLTGVSSPRLLLNSTDTLEVATLNRAQITLLERGRDDRWHAPPLHHGKADGQHMKRDGRAFSEAWQDRMMG
jgi:hypothetical protein